VRTGVDRSYPGSHGSSISGSNRSPATPYNTCNCEGAPAPARSSQSRHAFASSE